MTRQVSIASASFVARKSDYRFTPEQLDTLFGYVLVDDDPFLDAPVPRCARPEPTQEQINACWALGRHLLAGAFNRRQFAKLVGSMIWRDPTNARQKTFKDVRARFKNLRFCYASFSADHRVPLLLHIPTFLMGELQDAYKNHKPLRRALFAIALRAWLNPIVMGLTRRRLENARMATPDQLRVYHAAENAELEAALERNALTGEKFHKLRKIISRRVAGVDALRTLTPNPDLDVLAHRLATINGLMGQHHDMLVEGKLASPSSYISEIFEWPAEIADFLKRYLDFYRRDAQPTPKDGKAEGKSSPS